MLDSEDRARNPIGTGPFKFVSWTPDASLKVERNDDYWQTDEEGNQLPYLDAIEFQGPSLTPRQASALQPARVATWPRMWARWPSPASRTRTRLPGLHRPPEQTDKVFHHVQHVAAAVRQRSTGRH